MTYDDNGNKITEEFHRVGNSPWSTLRTYTWSNEGGQANQGVDTENSGENDETSPIMWVVILIVVLVFGSVYLIYSNKKDDIIRKFTEIDIGEVVEEVLEQE